MKIDDSPTQRCARRVRRRPQPLSNRVRGIRSANTERRYCRKNRLDQSLRQCALHLQEQRTPRITSG
ncbi:hypothetical protein, partial [Xanthomonas vesicatoria]|uniref:hypothetical protein n=1 Tax=Xanthomonas vesicatoria TaxID=56460 RepID=UPI001C12C923